MYFSSFTRVLLSVGHDADHHNLLQEGRPFIMRFRQLLNCGRSCRIDSFTTIRSQLQCGEGEHYCSDLSNPDLLRSRLSWCPRLSIADLRASVHTARSQRLAHWEQK